VLHGVIYSPNGVSVFGLMGNKREECVWRTKGTGNAHNTSVAKVNGRSRPGRHVSRAKNNFKTNSEENGSMDVRTV